MGQENQYVHTFLVAKISNKNCQLAWSLFLKAGLVKHYDNRRHKTEIQSDLFCMIWTGSPWAGSGIGSLL